MRTTLFVALVMSGAAACASEGTDDNDDVEDGELDDLADKADGVLADGSPEACGVLHVANTATYEQLDEDARLSSRAATNIVARRPFATIEALDAVPYVGPVAFDLLLDYAEATGAVEACRMQPPPGPGACPVPTGPFVRETLPGPFSESYRDGGALQHVEGMPVRVLATDREPNDYRLVAIERTATGWTRTNLVEYFTSITNDLVVTHGADACRAQKVDGRLRVNCPSLGGARTVAPNLVTGALSMARWPSNLQFVYFTTEGELRWQAYTTEPGLAEVIDETSPSSAYVTTSLAVDASGRPHVAYMMNVNGYRRTMYATRDASGWKRTLLRQEPTVLGDHPNTISLALVDDMPAIAYYMTDAKSLGFARIHADGTFETHVLRSPPPDFPEDAAGERLVLRSDCAGRLHIVYHREWEIDPPGHLYLRYARIEGNALVADVGLEDSPSVLTRPNALDLYIAPDGHQYITANDNHHDTYFTSR